MAKRTIKKKAAEATVSGSAEYLGAADKVKIIKRYNKTDPDRPQFRWWLAQPEHLASAVNAATDFIEKAQSTRKLLNIKFTRLYGNYDAIGFPYTTMMNSSSESSSSNRVALNIIQSVIDAVAAKVAKDQPKITFVTTGANDYFLKLRAVKLTKYMAGLFKQAEVYENSEMVFRDACVTGTGWIKVCREGDKLKTEWCPINSVLVDEIDGLEQKPRCMHQIMLRPKDMMIHKYPEFAEQITNSASNLSGRMTHQSTVDVVRVIESWHLPSEKGADDGLHTISVENAVLCSEPWEKDYFPLVPFRWMNRPLGYFGRSITEEIMTIQIEINKILRTIQQSQELAAIPIIFVSNEAEVAEDVLLTNTIARMVPYAGPTPPTFVTPTAQNQEVYNHLNSLIQWAFQTVGLSQSSASGMKPAGVDSAVAMREVADIETGRFAMVALRWEKFFVEVARILTDFSRDLYKDQPDLKVSVSERKILKEISWKDVDLKDNPFDIQTFPTSQLPDTPAGRIETISEYIQNQWISKERGMELLSLDPDLEEEVNLQTSSLRLTEKWLSLMVEEGEYHHPEPYMNLPLAQNIAQGVYCRLQHDNCPEDRLDLVRRFIDDIVALQQSMQQPPPPAPGPQGPGQTIPGTQPGNAPQAPSATPMIQTNQG